MAAELAPESKLTESGFRAQLREAQLADLVQMECLARSRRAIRITTHGDVGYLFFMGGTIVHATTLESDGEDAALEILRWQQGTFEPCEREFPARATISSSAQHLLLKAAQMHDEDAASRVVHLPPALRPSHPNIAVGTEQTTMRPATMIDDRKHDPLLMLRIDEQGSIIANKGATEEYAQMISYVCLLADLIGGHLGMEHLRALECTGPLGKTVIYRDTGGQIVAVKPSSELGLTELKERVGL